MADMTFDFEQPKDPGSAMDQLQRAAMLGAVSVEIEEATRLAQTLWKLVNPTEAEHSQKRICMALAYLSGCYGINAPGTPEELARAMQVLIRLGAASSREFWGDKD